MLHYKDIVFLSGNARLSLLMAYDPKINKDVWEKTEINDLAHWMFHPSLFDKTIDKMAANIAARLRTRTIKRQIAFLKKHNYLSPNNLWLAVKIIRGIMKAPVKNFAIIKKLEESYFITKEQKTLLWSHVFDGIPKNRPHKSYALFKLCEPLPFASKVTLRVVKKTKKEYISFQKLNIAIAA